MGESRPFTLTSPASFGGRLHGILGLPDGDKYVGPRPTVIICHGFKGFMEWGFFAPLADLLNERGLATVRFNYSGSGMQPGDELVMDLDAFRGNTFSLERDETLRILAGLEDIGAGHVDSQRVALVGHSRGGAAGVLGAASDEARDGLKALVTWAAISTFERYAEHRDVWRRDGVLPVKNGRTGQELELGIELLDDLEANPEALDLQAAASRVEAPWLVVHGDADEVVPVQEAHEFVTWAGGTSQLEVVPSGDHTFGAKHPFAGPTAELIRAMNATQLWLRRHLG